MEGTPASGVADPHRELATAIGMGVQDAADHTSWPLSAGDTVRLTVYQR